MTTGDPRIAFLGEMDLGPDGVGSHARQPVKLSSGQRVQLRGKMTTAAPDDHLHTTLPWQGDRVVIPSL
jgi:hypothetical protein